MFLEESVEQPTAQLDGERECGFGVVLLSYPSSKLHLGLHQMMAFIFRLGLSSS